jgi:hypothetical protein
MMLLFSDEIYRCINDIYRNSRGAVEAGANKLLVMNTSDSQAALLSLLDELQKHPPVYWTVINGLDKQRVLDGAGYYEKVLLQVTNMANRFAQLSAMSRIHALGHSRMLRVLAECLIHQKDEQLVSAMLSMLAGSNSEASLYRMALIIRQHPNFMVRRLATKQLVYYFEADVLLPLALGLVYSDTDSQSIGIDFLWQCITQNKIEDYEAQVVLALQYCLYSLPALGVMPYRCLMEINTPEAKAALAQWDVDNKSAEFQFFR